MTRCLDLITTPLYVLGLSCGQHIPLPDATGIEKDARNSSKGVRELAFSPDL
jgi:hypothetical protein